MPRLRLTLLAIVVALAMPVHAARGDLRSLTGMRGQNRALIVFTPSLGDARLGAQRGIMAQIALEAARRDLLFVQVDPLTVIGARDKSDKLRRRFHVPVLKYHAILLDKDGRVLREASGPMEGVTILQTIDRAPPLPAEVRRASAAIADHASGP